MGFCGFYLIDEGIPNSEDATRRRVGDGIELKFKPIDGVIIPVFLCQIELAVDQRMIGIMEAVTSVSIRRMRVSSFSLVYPT